MTIKELVDASFKTSSDKGFHSTYDGIYEVVKNEKDKKVLDDLVVTQKINVNG